MNLPEKVVLIPRKSNSNRTYPETACKNGITPEKQTIRSVLEDIAIRVGEDCWELKEAGQGNLFDLV